jgi:tripartite-type tricarboxylate transporter receptor subunit TctC
MKLPRRQFLHLAAGAAALPVLSRIARAQAYPTRPVRLIVPLAPGGATDIIARVIGQWLAERLGQPFIVENRPGAGTNLGTEAVVRAPPDGYTLLLVSTPNAINATLYDKLNFNFIRDIAPVAGIISHPLVIVMNPSVPAKTVPEFIAYAKANPRKLNMASPGNGTLNHVSGELFKMMAGVDMVHVPYRSGGPALTDLIAGQVQVMFPPLSHRSSTSGRVGCAHLQSPPRRAQNCCRTSRPWISSCRAMRRAAGSASARPRTHRRKLLTSSTRQLTPASPIPNSRPGSPTSEAHRLSARPPTSPSSSPKKPRSGAR